MKSERMCANHRFLSLLLTLTLVITLLSPAKSVSAAATPMFAKTSQSILVGDTYTISLKNKIAGAHYAWSSTDKSVAKVNQKGVVIGLTKGSATIRCKIDTKAKSFKLDAVLQSDNRYKRYQSVIKSFILKSVIHTSSNKS